MHDNICEFNQTIWHVFALKHWKIKTIIFRTQTPCLFQFIKFVYVAKINKPDTFHTKRQKIATFFSIWHCRRANIFCSTFFINLVSLFFCQMQRKRNFSKKILKKNECTCVLQMKKAKVDNRQIQLLLQLQLRLRLQLKLRLQLQHQLSSKRPKIKRKLIKRQVFNASFNDLVDNSSQQMEMIR